MSFELQLAQRRALVTGGTKGIGAAVVEALAAADAIVLATARSVPDRTSERVSYIAADNAASQRVAERLGASFDGTTDLRGKPVGVYRHPAPSTLSNRLS